MISISTAGIQTARVWLKRGYNFLVALEDGRDCIFIACNHGHINMLEFLDKEVKIDIFTYKNDGESCIEFTFRRAEYECFFYLLDKFC